MKKIFCFLVLVIIAVSAFAYELTFIIPDDILQDYRTKFLAAHPKLDPNMTDIDWIKTVSRKWFKRQYEIGEIKIYRDNYVPSGKGQLE